MLVRFRVFSQLPSGTKPRNLALKIRSTWTFRWDPPPPPTSSLPFLWGNPDKTKYIHIHASSTSVAFMFIHYQKAVKVYIPSARLRDATTIKWTSCTEIRKALEFTQKANFSWSPGVVRLKWWCVVGGIIVLHRSSVQHAMSHVRGLRLTVANTNLNISQAFFLSATKKQQQHLTTNKTEVTIVGCDLVKLKASQPRASRKCFQSRRQ